MIAKLFPELGEEVTNTVEAPHLQLMVEQSDRTGLPGGRITLTAEVRLPPDVHVYAPGTKGYKPINLMIDPTPEMQFKPAVYPRSSSLSAGDQGARPCFRRHIPHQPGLASGHRGGFQQLAGHGRKNVTIAGKLEYQACDSKICFLPTSVPVQWQLQVLPLDRQRAPEDIRHK